jgi:hypothetical protein
MPLELLRVETLDSVTAHGDGLMDIVSGDLAA